MNQNEVNYNIHTFYYGWYGNKETDGSPRHWNKDNYKNSEGGDYYDRMFESAIECKPTIIVLTLFNEWHEGTQIEPAVPKTISSFTYEDYQPFKPDYYIRRTKYWALKF